MTQRFASGTGERCVGKIARQASEQPMPVDRRVPIVAAVERRRELPRRGDVGVAIQDVTDLVRIFLSDTSEGETGEAFRSRRVEFRRVVCGPERWREEKQRDNKKSFHSLGHIMVPTANFPSSTCDRT